jgi:hypothetical protein
LGAGGTGQRGVGESGGEKGDFLWVWRARGVVGVVGGQGRSAASVRALPGGCLGLHTLATRSGPAWCGGTGGC